MTRARISVLAALVALFVAAGAGTAWAYWSASGSGNAAASGDTFPTTGGAKPSASVTGGTASIGFSVVKTNGGQPATGYTVIRYDSTGTTVKASSTGSCSTSGSTVTCTTGSVPDGTWTFGYQPLLGNWQGKPSTPSDAVTADATAPTISVVAIGPSGGSGVGFIHQGGTYYVYANASDATSGLASVAANVSTVTTGSTGVALTTTGGPFTVGGTTYSYRSAQLTANSSLSGSKTFTVTATDNASNSATANGSVTIDNTPPATPTSLDMTAASDSGSSSTDNITNVTKPTFTGSADANTTVLIFDGSTQVGSGTSNGSGAFSITLSTALTDGSHTITAKAIDAAENLSTASNSVAVTIDTTAPAPSGIAAVDDGTPGQIAAKNSQHQDALTLTFSDANAIDPASAVSGWNGSGSRNVLVTFTDGTGGANDSMTILGLGTVDLGGTGWLTGGSATATESLSMTSGKVFQLVITNTPPNSGSGNAASTFTWSAAGGTAKDVAGNAAAGSVQVSNQRF